VLVTSTSEIYGKNTSDRLAEEDDRILGSPLKSRWSYSEAKAIEEILAYTYWRQKGLQTYIVRLFNTGRSAADRSLRHGHPALRQPGDQGRAAHGVRRRQADALLLLRR
jgi:UDP-glucose 4-epimerase